MDAFLFRATGRVSDYFTESWREIKADNAALAQMRLRKRSHRKCAAHFRKYACAIRVSNTYARVQDGLVQPK